MKLLELSSKFINYVNSQDKVSLKNLNDDWNLSETFKKNVKSYLNNSNLTEMKPCLNAKVSRISSERIPESIEGGYIDSHLLSKKKMKIEKESKNDKNISEITAVSPPRTTNDTNQRTNNMDENINRLKSLIERFRSMSKCDQNNITTKLGFWNNVNFFEELVSILRNNQSNENHEQKINNDQVSSKSYNYDRISFDEDELHQNNINSYHLDFFNLN
jgi:hypothetical protein